MAVTSNNKSNINPDLYLSPDQQDLLLAALSSNNPTGMNGSSTYPGAAHLPNANPQLAKNNSQTVPDHNGMTTDTMSNSIYASPIQQTPGSVGLGGGGLDDSPFIDYDLEDGSFDWDNSGEQLIGNIPGTSSNSDEGDLHDKRKSPDDDKDDEEGGGKRREGDDRTSKKPGRKPLTSEPTSKRKAQNRAAQRAFRERKERHLKDLETKVEDLEKASESANHENGLLRAQVEQLQAELKGHRKRMSLNGTSTSGRLTSPSSATRHNSSSNQNFQFEFPNFGGLPGSQHFGSNSRGQLRANNESPGSSSSGAIPYSVPGIMERGSFGNTSPKANIQQNKADGNPSSSNGTSVTPWSPSAAADTNAAADLTSLFSPSILRNVSRSASRDYVSHNSSNNAAGDISRRSTENPSGQHSVPQLVGGSTSSDSTSPSASSVSQHGPGSSCGTSPEPSNYSPVNVKTGEYSLNTINEEHLHKGNLEAAAGALKTPTSDVNGIDWMAQQNGGRFDPMLFGNYRDPQDAITNNDFGGFFDDAFALPDFGMLANPFDIGDVASPAPKRDLMKEIEDRQNEEATEVVAKEQPKGLLSCNKLWEHLQSTPAYQNGELDMDNLCSELRTKAKCSETGLVVDQKEVDDVLRRMKAD